MFGFVYIISQLYIIVKYLLFYIYFRKHLTIWLI
nr:MAG TPA: hypothetical protein [Caudoviricetes sp.]